MLSGIFGKRHKLTFGSDSSGRFGAKKSYRAGARVTLRIPLATDTDYSIAADGVDIDRRVSGGIMICTFRMPDRDLDVSCSARNSMVCPVDARKPGLLYEYSQSSCAVAGEETCSRAAVCRDTDGKLRLHTYRRDGDVTEEHDYALPENVLGELEALTRQYHLDTWKDRAVDALDGKLVTISRPLPDGGTATVDSGRMPEDGGAAFAAFGRVLYGYATEDREI